MQISAQAAQNAFPKRTNQGRPTKTMTKNKKREKLEKCLEKYKTLEKKNKLKSLDEIEKIHVK